MEHWTPLIALHAIGATYALVMGAVVLFLPAKGSRLHRRLGRSWVVAMYWTVLSSFGIKQLDPGNFSWIHLLSIWTFISLTIALWAARTHRRELHRQWVVGSYFGLCGAAIAAMSFPQRLAPQLLVHRPLVFAGGFIGAVLLTVATVLVVRRSMRPGQQISSPMAREVFAQPRAIVGGK